MLSDIVDRSFPYYNVPKTEVGRGSSSISSRRGPNSSSPGTAPSQSSSFRWHQTPPSPPEKSNLDCAFPPPPTGSVPSKTSSAFPRNKVSKLNVSTHIDAPEPSPLYGPLSPRTYGGENVLQRMNGIAPGPFGIREQQKPDQRQQQNAAAFKPPQVPASLRKSDLNLDIRERSQEGHEGRKLDDTTGGISREPNHQSPATIQALPSPSRSRAFPIDNPSTVSSQRRPTEPRLDTHSGSNLAEKVGLNNGNFSKTGENHQLSAAFMHSLTVNLNSMESRYDPRSRSRQFNAGASRANGFSMGNPYHTPTESVSSNGSGYGSDTRTASSRSTPPIPESPERLTAMTFGGSLAANSKDNVRYAKDVPALQLSSNSYHDRSVSTKSRQTPALDLKDHHTGSQTLESPLDPVVQAGRQRMEPSLAAQLTQFTREPRPSGSLQAPTTTTAKKGNCRGCGETIQGKSVSSADGRLTGRYHKQCELTPSFQL